MHDTVWIKFECGGGARWTQTRRTTINDNPEGKVCNFSGCNCGTIVHRVAETTDLAKAHFWFRRPKGK